MSIMLERSLRIESMLMDNLLSVTTPVSEVALRRWSKHQGFGADEVERVLSRLVMRNEIRWVAFRGWCKGGRPS